MGKQVLAANNDPPPPTSTSPTTYPDSLVQTLADTLASGDQERARSLIEPVTQRDGYLRMAVGLLQPALYRIGERWQARKVSVSQEQLATALAQKLLIQQFTAWSVAPARGPRALFACVPGNHHAFEIDGWSVAFLGADVAIEQLIERIEQTRPALVGLSVSKGSQLPELQACVERIRAQWPAATPRLIAGGLAEWRDGESAAAFVNRADHALYRAKAAGGNRIVTAAPGT